MGYMLHCVPGNHPFDADDEGKRYIVMIDPRYPPEVKQPMNVYACGEHEGSLDNHCGDWIFHIPHGTCPGTKYADPSTVDQATRS